MQTKNSNYSFAVVSADSDIHLFFECVFENDFNLNFYSDCELNDVVSDAENFDFLFIDMPTTMREKRSGNWNIIYSVFKDRIFILTAPSEIPEYSRNFSEIATTIPYPFTRKSFFLFFNKEAGKRPVSRIASQKDFSGIPQFAKLVGSSPGLNAVKEKILLAADTECILLFHGESGTGKSVTAKTVHELSSRRDGPFVSINIATLSPGLIESELFGCVSGAFTGAVNRQGLFGSAEGGTLFIDEIGELSLECQSKILTVIDDGIYRKVGSDRTVKSNVRLIFATNANLELMVSRRRFREDLFYRITDFPIHIPSLRERAEDIPLLLERFLTDMEISYRQKFTVTPGALQRLQDAEWPGNIRQFKSCIRRACLLARNTGLIDESKIIFEFFV